MVRVLLPLATECHPRVCICACVYVYVLCQCVCVCVGCCAEEGGSDISAAKSIFTVHAIFGYIRSVLLSGSRSFEQVFG